MRSGVVAAERHHGRPAAHGVLIIKGAAAVIERMVGSDRLPDNYRQVRLQIVLKAAFLEQTQRICFSSTSRHHLSCFRTLCQHKGASMDAAFMSKRHVKGSQTMQ